MSRAAEKLGITQPSLSASVKRLEADVGSTLLIRNKSGVRTTRAGDKLAQQAQALLQQWERLKKEAAQDEHTIGGTYTLGAHSSVALYSLPGILPNLLSEFPNLELQLKHDLSRKITEQVIDFKVNFGVVINPVQHPDLVIVPICNDVVRIWTAPKNKNKDVLMADNQLIQSQHIMKKLGSKNKKFNRTVVCEDLEVIAELTAAGAGCGVLPTRVASRVKTAKLKALDKSLPIYNDKVCLVYRADMNSTEASKLLVNKLKLALKATLL